MSIIEYLEALNTDYGITDIRSYQPWMRFYLWHNHWTEVILLVSDRFTGIDIEY